MMKSSLHVGMDEVGRGSWAGPVVAAAVCFSSLFKLGSRDLPVRIDDSKKLTQKQREESALWIYEHAHSWGIGAGSVLQINRRGIVAAANRAFRKAFAHQQDKSTDQADHVFVDAFYIPRLGVPRNKQTALIRGDQIEFTIAAASIIAKVYRDQLMEKLHTKHIYREYCWDRNKGYGTKDHAQAISKLGTTKHHRILFVRNVVTP